MSIARVHNFLARIVELFAIFRTFFGTVILFVLWREQHEFEFELTLQDITRHYKTLQLFYKRYLTVSNLFTHYTKIINCVIQTFVQLTR